MTHEVSLYEAVGGQATFARLVDRFYTAVATDPVLRPMRTASAELALPAHHEATLWTHLERAAHTLVNQ